MKIGILGGGQLARMLALAAYPLGIRTLCIDPQPEACAKDVTSVKNASFEDKNAILAFLSEVDIVTYETENIPLKCAEWVQNSHPLYPSVEVLEIAQDRLHEKKFFKSLAIPTTPFCNVENSTQLRAAATAMNFPLVLKTRRMGYDGKGQAIIREAADIESAWSKLSAKNQSASLILEKFIDFQFELSLIGVRNSLGEIQYYPLTQNYHQQGILRWSEAPLKNDSLLQQAKSYLDRILNQLNYIGVLTIEFFYDGQQLIANEMAPRVHNSGHWTIEGAQTSQFENHIRAVIQWPLGSTKTIGNSFMLNCIGQLPSSVENLLSVSGVHYHNYGKAPRASRKLGHITLNETDPVLYAANKQNLIKSF
ncbi:MAG: 5-(carboxyamino)imidazole ribonucleotide synthase [Proteobacteria bacterium]|nr:5-(carboxyamino)imidazole ribonucleotide synthase [Pseudomonadota bacterium]